MAWASITYTFSPSTLIKSSEVNQNFLDCIANADKGMPSGGIILWSGSIANIPTGWFLCDGNNGTPNLVGKFIQGAGSGYAVGSTGGFASVNLQHRHYDDHTHNFNHDHYVTRVNNGSWESENGHGLDPGGDYAGITFNTPTLTTNSKNSQGYGAYTDYQLSASQEWRPPFYTLAYIMKS